MSWIWPKFGSKCVAIVPQDLSVILINNCVNGCYIIIFNTTKHNRTSKMKNTIFHFLLRQTMQAAWVPMKLCPWPEDFTKTLILCSSVRTKDSFYIDSVNLTHVSKFCKQKFVTGFVHTQWEDIICLKQQT